MVGDARRRKKVVQFREHLVASSSYGLFPTGNFPSLLIYRVEAKTLNRETGNLRGKMSSTGETSISVIIPALNESSRIELAVQSCRNAEIDEVIVVDGGSQDDTPCLAQQAGATLIQAPQGRARQQNLGARHASGDILLFLHADNRLSPAVGRQIRQGLADKALLGGAFLQRIEAEGFLYRWLEWGNATRVRVRGLAYGDQAIFIRRSVFEQLGGFPDVKLMEDLLLMRAFRKLSRPVVLAGPVYVSPRRWQQRGVVRQTLRNWTLLAAQAAGVAPDRLAKFYATHDTNTD